MRTLNTPLTVTSSAIAMSLLLSACSGGGTETTLDANPSVGIDLPDVLLNSEAIDRNNISPTIMLSNGASVTMQKGEGDAWSGTINVAPSAQYEAIVTWAETYAGQQLPLASLKQVLQVTAEGDVTITAATGYSVDIDTDQDGISNLQERENGTDPFNAPADQDQPENDATATQSESLVAESTVSQPSSSAADPETGTAQAPVAIDLTRLPPVISETTAEPTSETTPETTEPASEPTPETTPETTEPASEPTPETTPETTESASEPTRETTPETTEPASEPTPETTEPTSEPVASPATVIALADTVVPRIAASSAPAIDGRNVTVDADDLLTGEWAAAVQFDSSGAPLLIDNLIIDIDAEKPDGTPFRRWAAMHDGDYLYVVVIVDDNGDRQRDSLSSLIDDDSLELFLDGDNSKSSSYGDDDFHRIFPVQLPGADKRSANRGEVDGPNSSPSGLNVSFATGPGIGPRGLRRANFEQDVYELKIDLSSAGIDTDSAFGFELQVNDDDGGGDRDSKWAWKHPSRTSGDVDTTVENPSTMGTLKLE